MGDLIEQSCGKSPFFGWTSQPVSIFVAQQFGIKAEMWYMCLIRHLYEYIRSGAIYRTFAILGVARGT